MYRSIPLNIILTIVTCGLYGLYWFVVVTDDVNELSGRRNDTSGGMSLLFTIITCGIYGIYWAYKLGEKIYIIKNMYYGQTEKLESILYMVLHIIGLPIIVYALAQNEINNIIEGRGGYYTPNGNINMNANGYENGNMYGQNTYNQGQPNSNGYGQNGNNQNMYGQNTYNQNNFTENDYKQNNFNQNNNSEVEDYGDE